VRPIGDEVE